MSTDRVELIMRVKSILKKSQRWRSAEPLLLSIYGPGSAEDETYVAMSPPQDSGGEAVRRALRSLGFSVLELSPPMAATKIGDAPVDVIFLNSHGDLGECGRLQALCDIHRIPYSGSGL